MCSIFDTSWLLSPRVLFGLLIEPSLSLVPLFYVHPAITFGFIVACLPRCHCFHLSASSRGIFCGRLQFLSPFDFCWGGVVPFFFGSCNSAPCAYADSPRVHTTACASAHLPFARAGILLIHLSCVVHDRLGSASRRMCPSCTMACCARGALANILFSIIHGCGCAPGRESTQRELTTPLVVLHRSTSPNCVIILRLLQTALGAELLSALFQAHSALA